MKFTVFYYQATTGKNVVAEDGLVMEIEDVCTRLLPELQPPEDFLGVVDAEGTTVQMAVDTDHFWVEIPVPSEAGSYGMKVSDREVMIAFFRHLPETFSPEAFPELKFQAW